MLAGGRSSQHARVRESLQAAQPTQRACFALFVSGWCAAGSLQAGCRAAARGSSCPRGSLVQSLHEIGLSNFTIDWANLQVLQLLHMARPP
jgi:hypothetical protein